MDFGGVFQGILSNAIYAVIIIGGGVMLALFRKKWPEVAPTILYGVLGVTCIAILWFTFTGHGVFSKQPVRITPENAEENIRKWADSLGLGVTRASSPPSDAVFGLIVTTKGGIPVVIALMKEIPDYLQFSVQMALSEEHQAAFSKLTKEQGETVTEEVILELARGAIGNTILKPQAGPQMQTILLMDSAPVDGLTKDAFVYHVNHVDNAAVLVRAATSLSLKRMQALTLRPQ